jgi:antibiotic biosynthesis monooxygenase (ABM) superfamily enzyme
VGVGKHAVVLNAHAYKEWANEKNATLVQPTGKIDSEDGMFFRKGEAFNQGTIFDFDEDDFISACEEAIKKAESDRVNREGLKIQEDFHVSKTTDALLTHME